MPLIYKTDVLDLSAHNSVEDFNAVKNFGIKGIIHKASEGVSYVDPKYGARRDAARKAGLLWGAYAFATAAPPDAQARAFLRATHWDDQTLLCLDWEPYGANTMSLASAKEFLRIVYEETGQRPVLYSGNLVKEQGRGDPFLCQHRLWLAQYAAHPQIPRGWDKYWLWQNSGDGYGGYGTIPGISTKGIDCNIFGGDDLAGEWAGRPQDRRPAPAPAPPPIIVNTEPASVAADPAPVAAGPADTPAPGIATKITTVSSQAAAINELADQGSRLAEVIRAVKQWFWRLFGTATVGGTLAAKTVDPNTGNAAVVHGVIAQHPIWFAIGLSLLLSVGFYFAIKLIEKYLVTAANAGRYLPRSAAQ